MNVNVPTRVRQIGYIVFGVLAAAQTAAYAAYGAIHIDPPAALVAGSAAFAAVTTAPFVVATLNIRKDDPELIVNGTIEELPAAYAVPTDAEVAPSATDTIDEPVPAEVVEHLDDNTDNTDNTAAAAALREADKSA